MLFKRCGRRIVVSEEIDGGANLVVDLPTYAALLDLADEDSVSSHLAGLLVDQIDDFALPGNVPHEMDCSETAHPVKGRFGENSDRATGFFDRIAGSDSVYGNISARGRIRFLDSARGATSG